MKVFCQECEKEATLIADGMFSCGHPQPNPTSEERVGQSEQKFEQLLKDYQSLGYSRREAVKLIAQSQPLNLREDLG